MKIIFTKSVILLLSIVLLQCNKKDDFRSDAIEDYLQLQVGKYVIYRLDSLKFVNFGTEDQIVYYNAKDEVDAIITDNLGRRSYRVIRYLRDTLDTKDWEPSSTYLITPTRETVEIVEENFRFQKLKVPIREGYTWKGNSYISTISSDPNWDYRYYDDWDYTYENVGTPFTVFNNQIVNNSITVNERDEINGIPEDPNAYSAKTYSKEVYGKGIGLIYREFVRWEYQPPAGSRPGARTGYGIKLNMISHN